MNKLSCAYVAPDRHRKYMVSVPGKMMAGLFKTSWPAQYRMDLAMAARHKADEVICRSYDYFLTSFVTLPKHVVVRYFNDICNYKRCKFMGSNLRIDDELKARSYAALEKMG